MIPPDHPQAGPEPNTFWALKDVSFSVEQGEIVGVIGKNGAGKSTLLKILSRITEPTSGRAVLRGRVGSLLEVGTGFHPELTGRENIFLNGAILGMRRREIEKKFDEIVAFAEVEKFIDTPVKRYSSGMYVRLAFAVAAHLEPEILLVDEVLAVGDAAFQKKCLGKMKDVAGEGRTVLFVSHNMAAVEHLCPRCVWLEYGRVREVGLTGQVVGYYIETGQNSNEAGDRHANERPGTGSARVTSVEFLSADGTPAATFRSGQSWAASVHYRVLRPLIQPHFKVTIYSHLGVPVANMGTRISGVATSRQDKDGVVACILPQLLLVPGSYRVNVGIMDRDEVVDAYEYAGHFAVQGGNPLGSGLFPEVGSSIVHPVWTCHGTQRGDVGHALAARQARPKD